jgi:hypothetical protein
MKIARFATRFQYLMIAIVFMSLGGWRALAQEGHSHTHAQPQQTEAQKKQAGDLLKIVQNATEQYKDVTVAQANGYALQFGCVSGDSAGAMGLHFVNGELVNSGVIDARHPQIVIYEPTAGGLQLIGADYLVLADTWNTKHSSPPELMGQLFHLFPAPNRFGLPSFYTLHVWAWKDNPNGAFVNWHPDVNCEAFNGQVE